MKAIIFSDIHFHFWEKHNVNNKRTNAQLLVFENIVRLAYRNKCPVFFGGDLFNNPGEVTNKLLNYLSSNLTQIFEEYPDVQIYMISGNHDMAEKNTLTHRSPSYIQAFSNLFPNLHNLDFSSVVVEGTTFFGIPYLEDNGGLTDAIGHLTLTGDDILLMHSGFKGQKDTSGVVVSEGFNINEDNFKSFKYVLSGHIHKPGKVRKNIYSIGAPLQLRISDMGGRFGYWVLSSGDELRFKELTKTPKFRTYELESEIDNDTDIWVKRLKPPEGISLVSSTVSNIDPISLAIEYCKSIGITSKAKIKGLINFIKESNDHI